MSEADRTRLADGGDSSVDERNGDRVTERPADDARTEGRNDSGTNDASVRDNTARRSGDEDEIAKNYELYKEMGDKGDLTGSDASRRLSEADSSSPEDISHHSRNSDSNMHDNHDDSKCQQSIADCNISEHGSEKEKRENGIGSEKVLNSEGAREKESLLTDYKNGKDKRPGPLDHDVDDEFVPPEGGWGWLVCLASFWTNGTLFGILNIFGIFYVEFLDEFKDLGEEIYFKLSWIGALEVATTFFMSLFSSILVDMFGIQLISGIGAVVTTSGMLISSFVHSIELLYFTYGILIGLGSSLLYTPSMTILGHYFKRRLGIVNGVVVFGSAVFTFVLTMTVPVLLRQIGLRHTMRVMCAMIGILGVCPFIWRPLIPRHAGGLDAIRSTESIHRRCGGCLRKMTSIVNVDMFRNKGYRIWIIGVPIAFMGYFIPFVHIVEHTKQVFPGSSAELLVMCIGGISGVSRLISGKLADFPSFNRVWIMQFSFMLLGLTTSLVPYAGYYGVLVFLACAMGLADGCFICMLGPIAYDLLGPQGMGQGIGVLLALMSIPMTVGPPLAGFLRGLLGTYKIAFLIAGLPPIIGSCILFFMPKAAPKKIPELTMTDTIVAMSREHLDRDDEEETANSTAWPRKGSDVIES